MEAIDAPRRGRRRGGPLSSSRSRWYCGVHDAVQKLVATERGIRLAHSKSSGAALPDAATRASWARFPAQERTFMHSLTDRSLLVFVHLRAARAVIFSCGPSKEQGWEDKWW